ncbi:Uncharacterised protein [Mycobacteroides abscessus subsp. abscessus]|nr:Uncharacterised protein [Mycobacteroides abscessus subsp. abscessus]
MRGYAGDDLVEAGVVVDLPAERGDIFGGAALQQESALVSIQSEPHVVGLGFIQVHADGVASESAPVGEPVRFDDDIAEVDVAENRCRERGCLQRFEAGIAGKVHVPQRAQRGWT